MFEITVVIEPPDDHPNRELVSGERLHVHLLIPDDPYPWHEPWEGWKITQVVEEENESS